MVEILLVVTILWSAAGTILTVFLLSQARRDQADQADRTWKNLTDFRERLGADLTESLTGLRTATESRLESMRKTVEDKIRDTLDARLTQSLDSVGRQLLEVQRGLATMQSLAQDVGGLKKILGNVKTRGIVGEAALEGLLVEYLAPDQLERNVEIRPGSGLRVEFAVRLPGQEDGRVLLPVDAKFPREDYDRLVEAWEIGDKPRAETAGKAFEARLHGHALEISQKYLDPPRSTDFALLFLPFESLYAEALRRPGLFQEIQRRHKVVLTGPTTLSAFLNSLQMGFRTLAIGRRSAEVWRVLASVRTEFGRFGESLASVRKSLDSATGHLDQVSNRARKMERRLSAVDEASALPDEDPDGER